MAMSSSSKVFLAVLSLPLAVLTLLAYNKSFPPQELIVVARPQESSQPSQNFTKSRHDDTQRSHSSTTSRHDDTQRSTTSSRDDTKRFTGWFELVMCS